ncbi:MAG: yunF, partial [Paenibacillus sp.]|nr:yunF [Paenibacillus sp.]
MIAVGLAGWGDHDSLYAQGTAAKDKLRAYGAHFPIVEMDSSFYAVQPPERMARYATETPEGFGFVVKAYQGMTGHLRGKPYYENDGEMYLAFRESLDPVMRAGKLTAALFQYPPWFDCTKDNVRLLRETKKRMEGFPCALEFRHQSWFEPEYRERTLSFMREEGWIHSVCDEPQAGSGSIPIILEASAPEFTLVRMHGRNVGGWNQAGAPNWREVRYLYDY